MDESTTITDAQLAQLAKQGCENSFRGIFDRHYPAIHAYAWKLCGDSSAADDIAQQTFIKVAKKISSFNPQSQFQAWLYRIALNTARDHLRATARYRKRLDQLEAPQTQSPPEREQYELLAESLKKLSDKIQETVLLVLAQGLTQKEAAHVLQCSEGTVAWRISEARKILKQSPPTMP